MHNAENQSNRFKCLCHGTSFGLCAVPNSARILTYHNYCVTIIVLNSEAPVAVHFDRLFAKKSLYDRDYY